MVVQENQKLAKAASKGVLHSSYVEWYMMFELLVGQDSNGGVLRVVVSTHTHTHNRKKNSEAKNANKKQDIEIYVVFQSGNWVHCSCQFHYVLNGEYSTSSISCVQHYYICQDFTPPNYRNNYVNISVALPRSPCHGSTKTGFTNPTPWDGTV